MDPRLIQQRVVQQSKDFIRYTVEWLTFQHTDDDEE